MTRGTCLETLFMYQNKALCKQGGTLVQSEISESPVHLHKTRYEQWTAICLTGIRLRQLLEYSADYCKIYKSDTELIRYKGYNCIVSMDTGFYSIGMIQCLLKHVEKYTQKNHMQALFRDPWVDENRYSKILITIILGSYCCIFS